MTQTDGSASESSSNEAPQGNDVAAEVALLSQRIKFLQWLLGVFFLGLLTLIVNAALTWYEVNTRAENERRIAETARLEAERGFLKDFLDKALDDNLLKRKAFAEFMSTVNTNAEMRRLWGAYAGDVESDISEFQGRLSTARNALSDLRQQLLAAQDDATKQNLAQEIRIREAEIMHIVENVLSPTLVGEPLK